MGWNVDYSKILNPSRRIVMIFGLPVLLALVYWFYELAWQFYMPILFVGPSLLGLFLIITLVIYFIDKHFKTGLKKYAKTALVILMSLPIFYLPSTVFLDYLCDKQGDKVISAIKEYKPAYHILPVSLDDEYFDGMPKSNLLGQEFFFQKFYDKEIKDTSFYVEYKSFHKMTAYKAEFVDKWGRDDH
ncbi:hypothetical protein BH10BAC2_BH10BAC2_03940 [soil metagenome]